jgi:hypothetical protein
MSIDQHENRRLAKQKKVQTKKGEDFPKQEMREEGEVLYPCCGRLIFLPVKRGATTGKHVEKGISRRKK